MPRRPVVVVAKPTTTGGFTPIKPPVCRMPWKRTADGFAPTKPTAKRIALERHCDSDSTSDEKSINHRKSLHKDLARMWNTKETSDIEVQCSDGVIKAHRLILSARSEVFQTMFECGLSESKSNRVKVDDFKVDTMNVLFKYLYTGVVGTLTIQGISDLLRAADKYQLRPLKNDCFKLLMAQLALDNTAETILLAHVYNAPSRIKFKLQNHLIKNRLDLWKTSRGSPLRGLTLHMVPPSNSVQNTITQNQKVAIP